MAMVPGKDVDSKTAEDIVRVLDTLCSDSVWDKTLPLKVLKKRIVNFNNELKQEVAAPTQSQDDIKSQLFDHNILKNDEMKLYIVLHHTKGKDLQSWTKVISELCVSTHGRPIYKTEQEAKNLLSYKMGSDKDGYVEIWIKKNALIEMPKDKILYDKDGNQLLSILPNAIKKDNIKYFIHGTGKKFKFDNSKLVLVN